MRVLNIHQRTIRQPQKKVLELVGKTAAISIGIGEEFRTNFNKPSACPVLNQMPKRRFRGCFKLYFFIHFYHASSY